MTSARSRRWIPVKPDKSVINNLTISGKDIASQVFVGDKPVIEKYNLATVRVDPEIAKIKLHNKPYGGLWTSSLIIDEKDQPTSAWIEWCRSEMPGWENKPWWKLDIDPNIKLLRINNYVDLINIISYYYNNVYAYYGRNIDLEKGEMHCDLIREDGYHGILLTDEGQWSTRFSHPVDLYGWDCESTMWINWGGFTNISLIRSKS